MLTQLHISMRKINYFCLIGLTGLIFFARGMQKEAVCGDQNHVIDMENITVSLKSCVEKNEFNEYFLLIEESDPEVREALYQSRFENRNTALHYAAKHGNVKVIHLLMEVCPALIGMKNISGLTALHCAAWHDKPRAIITLLRYGVAIDERSDNGSTPLHFAAKNGALLAICRLYKSGASRTVKNRHNKTPVKEAANETVEKCFSHLDRLETLEDQVPEDSTIFEAVRLGLPTVRDYLKHPKINLRITDKEGNTPLHIAVRHNHLEIVRLLLGRKDVCITQKNGEKKTAMDYAFGLPLLSFQGSSQQERLAYLFNIYSKKVKTYLSLKKAIGLFGCGICFEISKKPGTLFVKEKAGLKECCHLCLRRLPNDVCRYIAPQVQLGDYVDLGLTKFRHIPV